MDDQDDVSSYVNSNVFEVGEVVAFRGTDGLPFNLLSSSSSQVSSFIIFTLFTEQIHLNNIIYNDTGMKIQ